MSAIGPKQTWTTALHMSAFGGKADMERHNLQQHIAPSLRRDREQEYEQQSLSFSHFALFDVSRRS